MECPLVRKRGWLGNPEKKKAFRWENHLEMVFSIAMFDYQRATSYISLPTNRQNGCARSTRPWQNGSPMVSFPMIWWLQSSRWWWWWWWRWWWWWSSSSISISISILISILIIRPYFDHKKMNKNSDSLMKKYGLDPDSPSPAFGSLQEATQKFTLYFTVVDVIGGASMKVAQLRWGHPWTRVIVMYDIHYEVPFKGHCVYNTNTILNSLSDEHTQGCEDISMIIS